MMKTDFPKVYIIILNYNGWVDTIECLESVLIVDNNSQNNSMEYIKVSTKGK